MESNIKNDLVKVSSFLEEINPQSINECTVEFKKSEKRTFEGILGMGKSAHIYKTKFSKSREDFILWCEQELSYNEATVKYADYRCYGHKTYHAG